MPLPTPTDPAGKASRFMRLTVTMDVEILEGKKPTNAELADAVITDLEGESIEVLRGVSDNPHVTLVGIQAVYTKHTTMPYRVVPPAILGQLTPISEEK